MKKIPTSYTFDKTAKTITCDDFLFIEKIALIVNLTTGDIIYQFNSATKGGTLAGNVLTLDFDTSAMTNSDKLQVLIHDDSLTSLVHDEDAPHVSGDKGIMMLAIRSDSDVSTADDGDYTVLKLDEQGRLKVSSKPASYADITGDITAIQATIGTPVVGGAVSGDVSRASNIMIFCIGTFAGVNCTFEGSLEASGETNWFGVQAIRSNANTIETTTGALSAQPVYAWEASVNALKRFRVRCTARTSGTQSWRFVQGTYATEPIPGAQITGTQPISGTVTGTQGTASAISTTDGSGGWIIRSGVVGITDIASAPLTTVGNSATASIVNDKGNSFQVVLPVTAVSGTTPTMDFRIEESLDGGANWITLHEFQRITATGNYFSPILRATGRNIRYFRTLAGTTPSFTFSTTRVLLPFHNADIRKRLFDRAINVNTIDTTSVVLFAEATNNVQLVVNMGAISTTAPQFQLEGSEDGVNFYSIGAPLLAVQNKTVSLKVSESVTFYRARTSTAGSGATLGYLSLKAF